MDITEYRMDITEYRMDTEWILNDVVAKQKVDKKN